MSINISDKFIDSTAKETCILEMTSSKPIIDKLSKYLTSFLLIFNIFILFNPHNRNTPQPRAPVMQTSRVLAHSINHI